MEAWPRADQVEYNAVGHQSTSGVKVQTNNNNNNVNRSAIDTMTQRNPSTNTRLRKNSSYLPPPNAPDYLPNVANSVFSSHNRSRKESNVTMVGSAFHNNNSVCHSKNPSITTVIDDTITKDPLCARERVENLLGFFWLHVIAVSLSIFALTLYTVLNIFLFFRVVIFQDRGSDVSYGNSLKLLPDEFNAVSFILFILSISLQMTWLLYICFKIRLGYRHLRDKTLSLIVPWTSQLIYCLSLFLECGRVFSVYGKIYWLSSAISGFIFAASIYCGKQKMSNLPSISSAEALWSSSGLVRLLEFYLALNAFSSVALLRLTDCVFYLFVTLQASVGVNLRLCEILLVTICILLLILYFYFEAFVLGDLSTVLVVPLPLAAVLCANALFSNIHRGKVLELYMCSFQLGFCCFLLCLKIVITLELSANQTSKEKFGYLSTNSQFMVHKRGGAGGRRSGSRKSGSQRSLLNRLSAHSTRKTRMNSVSMLGQDPGLTGGGVITITHDDRVTRASTVGRASVQFVEREQIPITPLPTESVTEMGDAFEEQQIASTNHNRRNSSDYNNMEDSGVSFMEFQNEFCRHYPNYPEI